MPYINVQLTKSGVTKDHKAQIIEEMTATLVRVLGKTAHIHIVLDLVDEENWGYAGQLTSAFRKSG